MLLRSFTRFLSNFNKKEKEMYLAHILILFENTKVENYMMISIHRLKLFVSITQISLHIAVFVFV